MNINCIIFIATALKKDEIAGKRVLEIGSLDVNGSARSLIEYYGPKEYVGVDISAGRGVDFICDARLVLERFGPDSFDVVIATELIEHIRDWRLAIHNIKGVCRPGGVILITTRSPGFKYHGYPNDFWRFSGDDIKDIFGDCIIERIEPDPDNGIFAKVIKPESFAEKDLSSCALYSVVTGTAVKEIDPRDLGSLRFKLYILKVKTEDRLHMIINRIFGKR